jgi:riboflavin-specific deaminase-like protein
VGDHPYTLLSCSMSIDGYLDSANVKRLPLSNAADLDRVDAVRAGCDAILVGAATVRNDNPRLLVRSLQHRQERICDGRPVTPMKVTVTASGRLDPDAAFFVAGDAQKVVYCPTEVRDATQRRLGAVATVVDVGSPLDVASVCADLFDRGVRRLMVEGGGLTLTQFLTANLVDELQLVVAPVFVGDSNACRFVGDGSYPWSPSRRAELAEVRQIGDVVLLRYALSERFCAE